MTAQVLLALSILALLSGPLAYRFAERSGTLRAAVDGFSIVTVASLALLELAPHALAEAGLGGIVPLLIGFLLPTWFHRLEALGRFSDHVLVVALLLHSAIEAAALGTAPPPQATALGLAILAHQLPVGLAAYSVSTSRRTGWIIIASLAVAMAVGFSSGQLASTLASSSEVAWLQALAAGSLLHVLSSHEHEPPPNYPVQNVQRHLARLEPPNAAPALGAVFELSSGPSSILRLDAPPRESGHAGHAHEQHHGHAHGGHAHHGPSHGHAHGPASLLGTSTQGPHPGEQEELHPVGFWASLFHATPSTRAAGLGALAGLTLVLLHPEEHSEGEGGSRHLTFLRRLYELSASSAPAVLLGYLLAGVVALVITEKGITYLRRGSRLGQALRAVAFGLPLPICSCGVLPVYESLTRRGVPLAAGIAFLVATPELGLDAALLSWPLLGWKLAVARLAAAFLVALLAALIVSRQAETAPNLDELRADPPRRPSVSEAVRFGLVEMFDHTMPWILFGLVLAALSGPMWDNPWLKTVPVVLQVPLMALVGMPLYVCASGATPLAAVAIQGGLSPGAAVAFLLTGPATNATTFGILARLHGTRVALVFGASVACLATLAGYAVHALAIGAPSGSTLVQEGPSLLEQAALFVLIALTLLSLLRQGPRGMLGQVTHAIH